MLQRFRSMFQALTRRRDFEAGMTEELHFHIEQYADDLVRAGVSREEALRRTRIEFGGLNSVTEECREARGPASQPPPC
jgi:putative ABC transport system permease protein